MSKPDFNIHDLLASVQHRYEKVTVIDGTEPVELRAPTVSELCEVVAEHEELLHLFDGPAPNSPEEKAIADKNIVLFKRAPRACAAISACALGYPGDKTVEKGILAATSDFQLNLLVLSYAMLVKEYEGVNGLFTRVLARMDELGLTELRNLILRILASTSTTTADSQPQSESSQSAKKKGSGRKAA
jgi:hypothetical protein